MNGAQSILAERRRQIEKEGWTDEHDDIHLDGSLVDVAKCYLETAKCYGTSKDWVESVKIEIPWCWPKSWDIKWWKPKTRRKDLVRAGALIAAEIDRLDRVNGVPSHNWVPSTLGHGNFMCTKCKITDLEAAAIGKDLCDG